MITFEKFQHVQVIITQLYVYQTPYFQEYYNLIAIDLNKQQKLDANPNPMQQVNFTRNQNRAEG